MERLKQNKALIDVLDTLDKITSTSKKSVSDKLNKELIDRLRALGVKDEEAEIILGWAQTRRLVASGLCEEEEETEEEDFN